ncbi:MAG: ATP-dependent sacrificial sulfur transferase LarE [Myxococcota bacterium]
MSSPDPVEARLRARLRELGRCAIALSGGVDSSVVAALAAEELGENALALTGVSASLDEGELEAIREFCAARDIAHVLVPTEELASPSYRANEPDRCYHCKSELYDRLAHAAERHDVRIIVDGTHTGDLSGHRPGLAAARERGVVSPLVDVAATKEDVRRIAHRLALQNAARPAQPCLSSRIAYGVSVTEERLMQVGEAERRMKALGFPSVRVRLHQETRGYIARVEVPRDRLVDACALAREVGDALKPLGFAWVTLDLEGLRSGSLLEVLR